MADRETMRDRLVHYRANPELSREQASARVSAYVYGNILIFASIVPLSDDDIRHWHGVAVVLGVAASTYLAHVFAHFVASGLQSAGGPARRADLTHELRDATPILSSAVVPALVLVMGGLHWLSPAVAIVVSLGYLFLRLALVGLLVERLQSTRPSLRTLIAGLALAGVAAAIAVVKVVIAH